MSQYEYDDEFTDESEGIKSLRAALKKAQKELDEAREQVQEFSKEKRGNTLAQTLESFGVNPKIATFIPSDLDASPEAVKGWLTEYGELFGVTPSEPAPSAGFYTEEEKAEIARSNRVDQAVPVAGSPQNIADQINGAETEAQLLAILRQAQD